MSVQQTVERTRIPFGGPTSSADLNKFIDGTILDIANLIVQANANEVNIDEKVALVLREVQDLRQRVNQLERVDSLDALRRSFENLRIASLRYMGDTSGLSFISGSDPSVHPNVNTIYGQATVPINSIQSKFYSNSITSGAIVPLSDDLNITVTPIFDQGSGETDHEVGFIKRKDGDPKRAFNGDNQDYWIRRVEFDLESDVSEIEVELTVQIPDQANAEANIIYVKPYPVGETDITNILTSPDLSEPTTVLDGFSAIDNARNVRYFISPQIVSQVRIRMRQRNWFEENGRKVFEYGLQELGVQLAEFDKAYTAGAALGTNHTMIHKLDAPTGFKFHTLHQFHTTPDYALEPVTNRHMHFQLALNSDGSDVRWDSDTNKSPQSLVQGINLGGGSSSVYIVTTLNWVATADGAQPLFEVGTSPVLEALGIQYSVVPE